MKIFLGDLVHKWDKKGVWTFPLNIAFISAYTKKKLSEKKIDCDITLYKDPAKIIESIKSEKPDIIALAYYAWNKELNKKIFEISKKYNPDCLTLGGGPEITSINANLNGAKKFFEKQINCNGYIINQGEKGFALAVEKFHSLKKNINDFISNSVPGLLINNIKNCNEVYVGEDIGALDDLNEIPSPYLNGDMDEYFDGPYIPIIETNRSCPYRCTFCAWGIGTSKLSKFDDQRIIDEIEYISKRCKKTTTLMIADANFGILERDEKFAHKMHEAHTKYKFPSYVFAQWNKTRSDRIIKTAVALKGLGNVGASIQSMNEDTLKAVKRKNFTIEKIVEMQNELKKYKLDEWFSELIIGLPFETKQTHIEANKKLIDLDFEIWNYNLHLLSGTEMDTEESRKNYFTKTGWRLHDNCYGIYEGEKIFELQETVLETHTLSIEDFRYFRFFHFLQQMMWGKRWYYFYLKYLKDYGIHPVDVFDSIIENCKTDNGKMGELFSNFMRDYDEAESFSTAQELKDYWEKDENFERLKNQDYGKLNMLYTYKIVLNYREAFSELLIKIARDFFENKNIENEYFVEAAEDILKFQTRKFVKINDDWRVQDRIVEKFKFNILQWIESDFKKLNKFEKEKNFNFFLTQMQKKTLETQLEQYKTKNINLALRNMTIYTDNKQFFYQVSENL